jgi:type III secretion protein U
MDLSMSESSSESSTNERNEAPTARRIKQARRSGQVAISRDLATALSVAVACVVLVETASAGAAGLLRLARESLGGATKANAFSMAAKSGFEAVLLNIAVPGGALMLVAGLVGVAQTRGLATMRPLRPDARRILPSLGRVLGRDQMLEAGRGFLGLCLLFAVAFWSIRPSVSCIAALGGASAARILRMVGVLGQRLAIHLTVAMLTLGAADYLWQRHRHGKALRMSRDEVKREHRESEGEPAHKAERLRLHHEFMQEQTLVDVTKADFVVVHTGVMAAAIRYDQKSSSAPVVLVKGEGGRAQAIAAAARAGGVPAFFDPDLARALGSLDEGGEIPEALYQRVAECLLRTETMGQTQN